MTIIVNAPVLPVVDTNLVYDEGEGQWFGNITAYVGGSDNREAVKQEFHDGDVGTVLSAMHGFVENLVAERLHIQRVYGFSIGGRHELLGCSGIVATTPEEVLGVIYKYLGRDYDAPMRAMLKHNFNYDEIAGADVDEFVRTILIEEGTAAWIGGSWKWENTGGAVFTLNSDRDVNRTA